MARTDQRWISLVDARVTSVEASRSPKRETRRKQDHARNGNSIEEGGSSHRVAAWCLHRGVWRRRYHADHGRSAISDSDLQSTSRPPRIAALTMASSARRSLSPIRAGTPSTRWCLKEPWRWQTHKRSLVSSSVDGATCQVAPPFETRCRSPAHWNISALAKPNSSRSSSSLRSKTRGIAAPPA